jgi:hypothetical protein
VCLGKQFAEAARPDLAVLSLCGSLTLGTWSAHVQEHIVRGSRRTRFALPAAAQRPRHPKVIRHRAPDDAG